MANNFVAGADIQIVGRHGFAEISENSITKQRSLHAISAFEAGVIVCRFSAGNVYTKPNYLTIQASINKHITLDPQFLQYTNHSCDPNIFFDTTNFEIIALKDIQPNDELSFFYPSTELDMAQPFICYCGSGNCLQNIKGAKYISREILSCYRLTDFIKQQLS